jgi:hypothetical protein
MPIPFKIEADQYAAKRDQLLNDPATSYWLKDAIRALEKRDPLDAVRDAEVLHALADARERDVAFRHAGQMQYAMLVHEQSEDGGKWVEYRRIEGAPSKLSDLAREAKRFCYRTGAPVMLVDVTTEDPERAPVLMHVRPTDQVVQNQIAADAAANGADVRPYPTDL